MSIVSERIVQPCDKQLFRLSQIGPDWVDNSFLLDCEENISAG